MSSREEFSPENLQNFPNNGPSSLGEDRGQHDFQTTTESDLGTQKTPTFGPAAFIIVFLLAALVGLTVFFGIPALKPFYSSWRVDQFIKQAERMLAAEDYRSANIMLKNAWRHLNNLDPDNPARKVKGKQIFILLSEASKKAGENDYPLYLGMALEIDPKDEALAVRTVRALIESKNQDIAGVIVPSISAAYPDNAEILHLLGIMLLERGELNAGYNALKRAAELAPNSEAIRLSLGTLEALSRDPEIAERGRKIIRQARQNPDFYKVATTSLAEVTSLTNVEESLKLWDEIIARYPDDFDARIKRLNLIQSIKPNEVRKEIDKLWNQFKTLSERLQLILRSYSWLSVADAQELINRLPDSDRKTSSARLLQISLDAANQEWNKVIDTAKLITEDTDAPDHQRVVAWLWIARSNKALGNEDVATTSIRNATQQAKEIPQLLLLSGQQLEVWGMHAEAQNFYRQAAKGAGPIQLIALNNIARYFQTQRNSTELLLVYEKLLQLQPANPLVMNNVAALLLMRNEQLARALDLAQQVYMANPANQRVPQIADTYALALALNKRVAEALEVYSKMPVTSLQNPSIRLHYARVLALAGDKDQAWNVLKDINTLELFREEQEMLDSLRKELL
jgi:Flp pilus assembly protein TadD